MATMNEYAVTYTLTTNSVQGWGSGTSSWIPSSGTISVGGSKGQFVKSGSTGRVMGEVTRVVCKCAMSSNSYGGKSKIECKLRLSDGSTILTSSAYSQYPRADSPFTFKWTPTEEIPFPDADLFSSWAIQFHRISGSSSDLYWRAYKDFPLTVTVYFHDINEMVGDSTPPAISSFSFAGTKVGLFLQKYSDITVSGNLTLDPDYLDRLVNTYTLTLTQGGQTIFTATQTAQTIVDATTGKVRTSFHVGTIATAGTVTVRLTVVDNGDRTATGNASFTVTAYSPPSIGAFVGQPIAQRYKQVQGDSGAFTNVAANDGNYVWFSFMAHYTRVGNNAVSSLTLLHGTGPTPGSNADSASRAIPCDFDTSGNQIFDSDTTIYPTKCTPSTEHWFALTIADAVTSTTVYCTIGKAEAIFNIERYGVGVGQFSTSTSNSRKFECAYPGIFGAGITGGFSYTAPHYSDASYNSDSLTGGTWVDGKPIWRLVYQGKRSFTKGTDHITAIGLGGEVSSLLFIQGYIRNSEGLIYPIPCAAPSLNWALTFQIQGKSVLLYYLSTGGWAGQSNLDFGVIVEYTRV